MDETDKGEKRKELLEEWEKRKKSKKSGEGKEF